MQVPRDAILLRIFIGENDRSGGHPPFEGVVHKTRGKDPGSATLLRGPRGFGPTPPLPFNNRPPAPAQGARPPPPPPPSRPR